MEARQLFTLAQMHYFETGDYRTFADYGWTTVYSGNGLCSRLRSSSNYYDQAQALCQSIISKLPTATSSGSHNNKLIMGCSGSESSQVCPSGPNQDQFKKDHFSVQVKLQDNNISNTSSSNKWFCIGSSGQTYEGIYSINSPGCVYNP